MTQATTSGLLTKREFRSWVNNIFADPRMSLTGHSQNLDGIIQECNRLLRLVHKEDRSPEELTELLDGMLRVHWMSLWRLGQVYEAAIETIESAKWVAGIQYDLAKSMSKKQTKAQAERFEKKLAQISERVKEKRKIQINVPKNIEQELKNWLGEREYSQKKWLRDNR